MTEYRSSGLHLHFAIYYMLMMGSASILVVLHQITTVSARRERCTPFRANLWRLTPSTHVVVSDVPRSSGRRAAVLLFFSFLPSFHPLKSLSVVAADRSHLSSHCQSVALSLPLPEPESSRCCPFQTCFCKGGVE